MAGRGRPTKLRVTELGRYLAEQRAQLEWTVTDLASKSGVPLSTVSRIERGTPRPRVLSLDRLAGALQVHPDRLLVRAGLTPYLRPAAGVQRPDESARRPATFMLSSDEQDAIETYLEFLRFSALQSSSRSGP